MRRHRPAAAKACLDGRDTNGLIHGGRIERKAGSVERDPSEDHVCHGVHR
ncbi:hypothetical protein N8D55_10070 [Xanthomonas hortorum pv. pelargonii]|nr:hypothetical protein N8D55_10070 [Xanthomonas hortorum pv. pelargonii]